MPEAVSVKEGTGGQLMAVKVKRWQTVTGVEDGWRIDDEWWRSEAVSRLYYAVLLASGQRLVIAKNLADGNWYRQSY